MTARQWVVEADHVDASVYAAIAATETPALDRALGGLSRAADYSRLSLVSAALLALTGGRRGRAAAGAGVVSLGVTAALVNLMLKPIGGRRRPDRSDPATPIARQVPMPISRSLPSGHAATAFAFATGAGSVMPQVSAPLHALASAVAYSRVHTGVHYPGDVVAGALIGSVVAQATVRAVSAVR